MMKRATIGTKISHVIICPYCGEGEHAVDHLFERGFGATAGPWYCDACGGSYNLVVTGDGEIEFTSRQERMIPTLDVLVLPPQSEPVYFVVKGLRFTDTPTPRFTDDIDPIEHKRFFYEEHSCPTNWLKPEMIIVNGDSDPHGILKFLATEDASAFPPDEDVSPNAHDAALEAFVEYVAKKSKTL